VGHVDPPGAELARHALRERPQAVLKETSGGRLDCDTWHAMCLYRFSTAHERKLSKVCPDVVQVGCEKHGGNGNVDRVGTVTRGTRYDCL
jgi:hypothetical protein